MARFDRKICLNNIYHLMKKKGLKVGELEDACNVSVGYLSRLNKEGNTSTPSIDFLAAVAERLGVPLEALISQDLSLPTPTEKYLLGFIEKLISDTMNDKLAWRRESVLALNTISFEDGEILHPLFDADFDVPNPEVKYVSRFSPNRHPFADSFVLQMTSIESLYLMNVLGENEPSNALELYLVQQGTVNPLCQSAGSITLFDAPLTILYSAIVESCGHPKLQRDVLSAIDDFMADRLQERENEQQSDVPF